MKLHPKKSLLLLIIPLTLISCSKSKQNDNDNNTTSKPPVSVIYDTDMCFDVDDVGALAILNALQDMGEAKILAVCYNEVNHNGPAAIDAINTWYKHGDIPVGIYKKSLLNPDSSPYLSYLASYSNDIPSNIDDIPDAVDLYVQVLSEQPDSSVVIISVGFLNNLENLMEEHSQLISKKVKQLVIMGGINNDDFNLVRHGLVDTTENVFRNWPTPIVVSQLGGDILTGDKLQTAPQENPVREAYYRFFNEQYKGRSSWDLIAALYAIRGSGYFKVNFDGTGSLSNGYTYNMQENWRSYITGELSNEEYTLVLNSLLARSPIN